MKEKSDKPLDPNRRGAMGEGINPSADRCEGAPSLTRTGTQKEVFSKTLDDRLWHDDNFSLFGVKIPSRRADFL